MKVIVVLFNLLFLLNVTYAVDDGYQFELCKHSTSVNCQLLKTQTKQEDILAIGEHDYSRSIARGMGAASYGVDLADISWTSKGLTEVKERFGDYVASVVNLVEEYKKYPEGFHSENKKDLEKLVWFAATRHSLLQHVANTEFRSERYLLDRDQLTAIPKELLDPGIETKLAQLEKMKQELIAKMTVYNIPATKTVGALKIGGRDTELVNYEVKSTKDAQELVNKDRDKFQTGLIELYRLTPMLNEEQMERFQALENWGLHKRFYIPRKYAPALSPGGVSVSLISKYRGYLTVEKERLKNNNRDVEDNRSKCDKVYEL